MSDNNMRLEGINWSATFPHTSIFRSFKMAIHPSKMLLGTATVIAVWLYGTILDAVFGWFKCAAIFDPGMRKIAERISILISDAISLNILSGPAGGGVLYQLAALLVEVKALFLSNWFFGLLLYAGMLVISGLALGALARIAALQSAKDEKISLGEALSFSRRKFISFVAAPAIPVIIVVGIGIALIVGAFILGWLLNWIKLGYLVSGALMGLALLGGLVAGVTIIATSVGLPLMYPTIAVEGSDAFDAVSRSYSYVFSRPWQAAFAGLIALIYGGLCFLFLRLVLFVTLVVTHGFVIRGWGGTATHPGLADVWLRPHWNELWATFSPEAWAHLSAGEKLGVFLIAMWVYLFIAVLLGWVLSFYVCASTQVYYLLRKEVDATEPDDVFVEEYEDEELIPAPAAATTGGTEAPASPAETPAVKTGEVIPEAPKTDNP